MQYYSPAKNIKLVQFCCTSVDLVWSVSQLTHSVGRVCLWQLFLFINAVVLCLEYVKHFILSSFSLCIITDEQLVVESTLYSLHGICVYIVLSFRLVQRWSSLSKVLSWLMLGWPLYNFAQGLACVNSTVNIKIWTTALRNSELVSLAMPQGFPAMRKAITITLSKVSPHLLKLAGLASVGVCGRYRSWMYIWCYVTSWQWFRALFALSESQYVTWMWLHIMFLHKKHWYNSQYSAIRQNQGHWMTCSVHCVILWSGACVFFPHTCFGPSYSFSAGWSAEDIFLASFIMMKAWVL